MGAGGTEHLSIPHLGAYRPGLGGGTQGGVSARLLQGLGRAPPREVRGLHTPGPRSRRLIWMGGMLRERKRALVRLRNKNLGRALDALM